MAAKATVPVKIFIKIGEGAAIEIGELEVDIDVTQKGKTGEFSLSGHMVRAELAKAFRTVADELSIESSGKAS